jgi:FtsH-binding integral membrane protein
MNRAWATAIAADAAVVLLFAVVGRSSHDEGLTLAGVARTAWPFLAGTAVGLGLAAFAHDDPRSNRAGIRVWLLTLAVGMVLRRLTDAGTAASFVVVATVVLGVLFLGWRFVARVRRWTRPFRRS